MDQLSENKRIILNYILIIVLLGFIVFGFKTSIIGYVVNSQITKVEQKLGLSILYSDLTIKGVNKLIIEGLFVSQKDKCRSLNAAFLEVKLPLSSIFNPKLSKVVIRIDTLRLNINPLILSDSISVFENTIDIDRFNGSSPAASPISKDIISQKALSLINYIYKFCSIGLTINDLTIYFDDNDNNQNTVLYSDVFSIMDGVIESHIKIFDKENVSHVNLNGFSDDASQSISLQFSADVDKKIQLPLTNFFYGFSIEFDTLKIEITRKDKQPSSFGYSLNTATSGLIVNHPTILDGNVLFSHAAMALGVDVSPKTITVDSTSVITINNLTVPLKFSLSSNKGLRAQLSINTGVISASSLFKSLPIGLFNNLNGVKVDGNILFELDLAFDFWNLDSLKFSSKLIPINFSLLSFGNTNFKTLNDTFTYHIYRNDSVIKSVKLNEKSKYFRKLEDISPYVADAVVVSEDGGFYFHEGFDSEGFQNALIRNIKEKRLGRGGSTITMQLVKNLYLNQNKTLTRKAEEALIVWLIETLKLVSKERILEIYLNIIDWGPGINGIAEASEYYFQKDPIEIDLNEAIFLSSIIPQPSNFYYLFTSIGELKPHMIDYYNFVGKTMHTRNKISETELELLTPNIVIGGNAKRDLLRHFTNKEE